MPVSSSKVRDGEDGDVLTGPYWRGNKTPCGEAEMSDTSGGPGWWEATDGKWYPPERHPKYVAASPPTDAAPRPGWWKAADGEWYPPERHPCYVAPSSLAPSSYSPTSPAVRSAFRVRSTTSARRRRLTGGVVVVALVVIVGAVVLLSINEITSSDTHTVKGTVEVLSYATFALGPAGASHCGVPPSYGGEMDGEKVTVVNGSGRALRTGTLSNSVVMADGNGCQFSFTVPDVPNSTLYSVKFGHHMGPVYSLSEMQAANWKMAFSVVPPATP